MADQDPQQVTNDLINAVQDGAPVDTKNLTLEQLVILVNTERVRSLEAKSKAELQELKARYAQVRTLNDLRKLINNVLSADGSVDLTKHPELLEKLNNAKSLGVPVVDGKTQYSKEEADRLLDNVKMTIDDLNVQNDLQMQQVSRLQNDHHESFQLAMSIMRPIHNAKQSSIRAIGGGR